MSQGGKIFAVLRRECKPCPEAARKLCGAIRAARGNIAAAGRASLDLRLRAGLHAPFIRRT